MDSTTYFHQFASNVITKSKGVQQLKAIICVENETKFLFRFTLMWFDQNICTSKWPNLKKCVTKTHIRKWFHIQNQSCSNRFVNDWSNGGPIVLLLSKNKNYFSIQLYWSISKLQMKLTNTSWVGWRDFSWHFARSIIGWQTVLVWSMTFTC